MDRSPQRGYKAAKERLLKSGTTVNNLKIHLRKLFLQKSRNLREKSVDAIRCIKEEISNTSFINDEEFREISEAEMQMILDEVEREMNEEIEHMQVLAYEDETQNFIDYMVKEDITCRRCGVSSHKNINDEHKCYVCGFDIFNLES